MIILVFKVIISCGVPTRKYISHWKDNCSQIVHKGGVSWDDGKKCVSFFFLTDQWKEKTQYAISNWNHAISSFYSNKLEMLISGFDLFTLDLEGGWCLMCIRLILEWCLFELHCLHVFLLRETFGLPPSTFTFSFVPNFRFSFWRIKVKLLVYNIVGSWKRIFRCSSGCLLFWTFLFPEEKMICYDKSAGFLWIMASEISV